jgi:DNA primase catalytic core
MEIQEIKQRLSILTVLSHYGLKTDKNDFILCPFHDDHTPSLKVYPKTNTFHCFGCGASGDQVEFIQLKEKCTKHEAILKAESLTSPIYTTIKEPQDLTRIAVLTKYLQSCKSSMQRSKAALGYCKNRNLPFDKSTIGFNSASLMDGWSKALKESALQAGLLTKTGSGHSQHFRNCIVFELQSKQGQAVGIYGRHIDEKSEKRHVYLPGHHQGIYPRYPKPETKKLIITESVIDAATLLGIPEITKEYEILAAYGTNGLTDEHVQAIKELTKLSEIIFAFDGDAAGKDGTKRNAEILHQQRPDITISYLELPENEDINSLAQSHEVEIFTQLLNQRKPVEQEVKKDFSFLSENPGRQATDCFDTANPHRIRYTTETALYTVKGGVGKQMDSLKVSLDIAHRVENAQNGLKYRTKADLYEDRQVQKLSREAGEKLGLRADLLELELNRFADLLEEYRENLLDENEQQEKSQAVKVPPETERGCIDFLRQPDLINNLNALIGETGLVGEETTRLFLFIAAASHRMPDTLHVLVQGSSGSGKTRLMKRTADCMPQESTVRFTRVTENSFYNYQEYFFVHKLVCFEDVDGLKEEAQYAVRELISNEVLTSSTSVKDENGNISAKQRTVRGPIASMSCTTRGHIYEDNMSRTFIVAVDESPGQTKKIIDYQNRRSAGLVDEKKETENMLFLQNLVRTLRPYPVVNPYGDKLLLPEEAHKIRRLTELYHAFVKQVTLLHQYQRKKDMQGRLLSEKEDLQAACRILFESIVLKVDELDGPLRAFYEQLKEYIKTKGEQYENYQFSQREVRHALKLSKSQLFRYITDLVELEYLQQSGGYANRGFKYKITWWDNIHALRSRIKKYLQDQIDSL